MVAARPVAKTSTSLADGRALIYFDDHVGVGHPEVDSRELAESSIDPELRFDPLQEEWVIVASHRQERTHLPPLDECPLCPSTPGHATEIPAADYDVVVFENRFPSLTPLPETTSDSGLLAVAGGVGQCEVICFSSDHETSFSYLSDERLSTIADSIVDRTQDLSQIAWCRVCPGLREPRIRCRGDSSSSSWPDLCLSVHPTQTEEVPSRQPRDIGLEHDRVSLLCCPRRGVGRWASDRGRDRRTSSPTFPPQPGGPMRSTSSHGSTSPISPT